MVKKVTAPKTHKPSGNRPLEHLAYLNAHEMNYLRGLNGGYMERGPRGLPSFAEETVAGPKGSGGSSGSRGSSSSASSSSGGGGGTSGSSSTAPKAGTSYSTTGLKQPTDDRVMMTDANGVQYGYDGKPINNAPTVSKSNSLANQAGFSGSMFGGGRNPDAAAQKATQIKDAISTVKNTPAVTKDTAPVGGIKSLGIGSSGPRVSAGGSATTKPGSFSGPGSFSTPPTKPSGAVGPSKTTPTAKIGMSAPKGFYDGMTTDRENAMRDAQRQAERESSGLYGRSKNDPRDTVNIPSRTAESTRMTPGEKQSIRDAINPVKVAGGIYNDPIGSASRFGSAVVGGIQSLGNYMSGAYNTIARGAVSPDRYDQKIAAEKAAEAALNYGLTGSAVSKVAGVPKNALGSLAVGRSSRDPAVQNMFSAYDAAIKRGATPEQAFYESQKFAPSYAGGVVEVISEVPKSPNYPVKYAQGVEIDEPFDLVSSGALADIAEGIFGKKPLSSVNRYDNVFKPGPINKSYPTIGNMPVYNDITAPPQVGGTYYPSKIDWDNLPKPVAPGDRFNAIMYGSTAINAPMKRDWAQKMVGSPDRFRETAAHEGLHRVADMDMRSGVSSPIPQGTSPEYQESLVRRSLQSQNIPLSQDYIRGVGLARYYNAPGEVYARKAQDLSRTINNMRNYDTRFGALTEQELRNMMLYGIAEP